MDNSRLTEPEITVLRARCGRWGALHTATEFRLSELELLRAMAGLQAPEVVAKVRPKLAELFASLEARHLPTGELPI